jgi:hypothetical protein
MFRALLAPLSATIIFGGLSMNSWPLQRDDEILQVPPVLITRAPFRGELLEYLSAIGERESRNNYRVVNRWGFLGKYQFNIRTLYSLGSQYKVSRWYFLTHPSLQDSAMIENLKKNRSFLQDIITRYDGTWYHGIYVTESGILAGAHLVGPLGVLAYFNQYRGFGAILKDANGTHVRDYIREFSGYSLAMLN